MHIKLEKVIPLPVKEIDYSQTEIWLKENLIFESGQKYLIKSVSGKGKTTFLSIIYGNRKDYEGDVFVNDINIRNLTLKNWSEIRQNKLSHVFQGLDLFPDLTVLENLLIKNQISDFKTEKEITEICQLLEIESLIKKKAGIISFGQKQRVAIVRSLCQDFDFILLDEPFSHLDKINIENILKLLTKECEQRNAGMILTSLGDSYSDYFDKTYNL